MTTHRNDYYKLQSIKKTEFLLNFTFVSDRQGIWIETENGYNFWSDQPLFFSQRRARGEGKGGSLRQRVVWAQNCIVRLVPLNQEEVSGANSRGIRAQNAENFALKERAGLFISRYKARYRQTGFATPRNGVRLVWFPLPPPRPPLLPRLCPYIGCPAIFAIVTFFRRERWRGKSARAHAKMADNLLETPRATI